MVQFYFGTLQRESRRQNTEDRIGLKRFLQARASIRGYVFKGGALKSCGAQSFRLAVCRLSASLVSLYSYVALDKSIERTR